MPGICLGCFEECSHRLLQGIVRSLVSLVFERLRLTNVIMEGLRHSQLSTALEPPQAEKNVLVTIAS